MINEFAHYLTNSKLLSYDNNIFTTYDGNYNVKDIKDDDLLLNIHTILFESIDTESVPKELYFYTAIMELFPDIEFLLTKNINSQKTYSNIELPLNSILLDNKFNAETFFDNLSDVQKGYIFELLNRTGLLTAFTNANSNIEKLAYILCATAKYIKDKN